MVFEILRLSTPPLVQAMKRTMKMLTQVRLTLHRHYNIRPSVTLSGDEKIFRSSRDGSRRIIFHGSCQSCARRSSEVDSARKRRAVHLLCISSAQRIRIAIDAWSVIKHLRGILLVRLDFWTQESKRERRDRRELMFDVSHLR